MISAKRINKILLLFLVSIFSLALVSLFVNTPKPVNAAISGCNASVSPTEGQAGSQFMFVISLTNNDPTNSIKWFKITKPHSGTTLQEYMMFPAWYVDQAGDSYVFKYYQTPIAPGVKVTPGITIAVGDITGATGNWSVQVSDDPEGANPINCTGNLSFSVTGETDVTAPVISALTITDITASTFKVSWNTDEPATAIVQYDVNAQEMIYPFSKSDTNLTTAHSLVIDQSIAPNTTYYYRICSSDGAGNQTCSGENAITTTKIAAVATSAPTQVTVIVATPVPGLSTATVAPIAVIVDRTPPTITITTDFPEPFEIAPTIKGKASDNKGVSSVDYSTDGGKNWLPADVVETPGEKSSNYEFTPMMSEDGNYEIRTRARDAEGNIGQSAVKTLVIDRLPPRVGGNLLSLGPLALLPNAEGVILTMQSLEQRLTLSAVGGPTTIDLLVGDKMSSLSFSAETGLWTGAINITDPGTYQLKTKAVDGAGNKTERNINSIRVLESGGVFDSENNKPVKEGVVTLYTRDTITNLWSIWDGETFGQENPQKINGDGKYAYFLPAGTYYLTIKVPGKGKMTSKIFTLDKTIPFNADFYLKPPKTFNLGFVSIPLPSIFSDKEDVILPEIKTEGQATSLEGSEAPAFILKATNGQFDSKSLSGQSSLISFISTWSPPATEQLAILNDFAREGQLEVAVVASQETDSKVTVFQKRANYSVPIVIDKDGELIEKFKISSLPTHFFLDRKGVIKKVVTGVLSIEEIKKIITESL